MISVTGQTYNFLNPVTILVTAPNGMVVAIDQVEPNPDGEFETYVQMGGYFWKQDGWYEISAQQGHAAIYQTSVRVEVSGGAVVETSVSESSIVSVPSPFVDIPEKIDYLSLEIDAPVGSASISVTGQTDRMDDDITLTVHSPSGNLVHIDQLRPDQDGHFDTVIIIGCPTWNEDGIYTIQAKQGENVLYMHSMGVELENCVVVPEFGTVAILVLATAILSITAITARSRLGLVMRQ